MRIEYELVEKINADIPLESKELEIVAKKLLQLVSIRKFNIAYQVLAARNFEIDSLLPQSENPEEKQSSTIILFAILTGKLMKTNPASEEFEQPYKVLSSLISEKMDISDIVDNNKYVSESLKNINIDPDGAIATIELLLTPHFKKEKITENAQKAETIIEAISRLDNKTITLGIIKRFSSPLSREVLLSLCDKTAMEGDATFFLLCVQYIKLDRNESQSILKNFLSYKLRYSEEVEQEKLFKFLIQATFDKQTPHPDNTIQTPHIQIINHLINQCGSAAETLIRYACQQRKFDLVKKCLSQEKFDAKIITELAVKSLESDDLETFDIINHYLNPPFLPSNHLMEEMAQKGRYRVIHRFMEKTNWDPLAGKRQGRKNIRFLVRALEHKEADVIETVIRLHPNLIKVHLLTLISSGFNETLLDFIIKNLKQELRLLGMSARTGAPKEREKWKKFTANLGSTSLEKIQHLELGNLPDSTLILNSALYRDNHKLAYQLIEIEKSTSKKVVFFTDTLRHLFDCRDKEKSNELRKIALKIIDSFNNITDAIKDLSTEEWIAADTIVADAVIRRLDPVNDKSLIKRINNQRDTASRGKITRLITNQHFDEASSFITEIPQDEELTKIAFVLKNSAEISKKWGLPTNRFLDTYFNEGTKNPDSRFGFNKALFDELLPLITTDFFLAKKIKNLNRMELKYDEEEAVKKTCHKFSTLFSSLDEVKKYITRYQETHPHSIHPIHDACLFKLPQKDIWDIPTWRALVLKHGYQIAALLPFAAEVEAKLNPKMIPLNLIERRLAEEIRKTHPLNIKPVTHYEEQLRKRAEKVIAAKLKRNEPAPLIDDLIQRWKKQREEESTIRQKIKEDEKINWMARRELIKYVTEEINDPAVDVSQNIQTRDLLHMPLSKLMSIISSIAYKRANELPDFATACIKFGVDKDSFNRGLDTFNKGKNIIDVLPEIFIDGKDLGLPGLKNYYFQKLSKRDWRGVLLGGYTGCCQIIGSDAEKCARHGATSCYAGFYVIMRKVGQNPDPSQDEIVAQSYAWLSENGTLVFDSLESMRQTENQRWLPFYETAARKMLGHKFIYEHEVHNIAPQRDDENDALQKMLIRQEIVIKQVTLGQGGGTPEDCEYPVIEDPQEPLDDGPAYYDSNTQWVLAGEGPRNSLEESFEKDSGPALRPG